jgi:hypothetical protein
MKARRTNLVAAHYFFLGLVLSFLANCGGEGSDGSQDTARLENRLRSGEVVLSVEGAQYLNADFEKYVREIIGSAWETLDNAALSRLFDSFVEDKLLLQSARDQNIVVTQEEKKGYLAKLSRSFLPENGRASFPEWSEDTLTDRLLVDKCINLLAKNISITESEVQEYYTLHKKDFLQPERYKASQIFLDTKEKADQVWNAVKNASEADFRAMATAESRGLEAAKGGEMGIFSAGQLPENMEKAIFSLPEGGISPVVKSSYGYHIFRLDKKFELELMPLEKAQPSIRVKLLDRKIKLAISIQIDQLKKNKEWASFPEKLFFPYQRIGL